MVNKKKAKLDFRQEFYLTEAMVDRLQQFALEQEMPVGSVCRMLVTEGLDRHYFKHYYNKKKGLKAEDAQATMQ